ncbi:MAG TPA: phosphoribosylformylglycinamidine synthase subunit PurS [Phycisphaerae bacterium]|nr:phosphoribosylformylglycinamidine synthase subunit PurS [Phycisphaerae bacterium]
MQLWRISVAPKSAALDAHGAAVLKDIHELGRPHVKAVASSRLYLLEGTLPRDQVERIAAQLLVDPVTETFTCSAGNHNGTTSQNQDCIVEVHLKGGVMDPVANSALAAIEDMGIAAEKLGLSTARLYRLKGVRSIEELEFIARRLLFNDCIEDVYLSGFGRHDPRPDRLPVAPERPFELRHVAIRELDEDGLRKLSREGHLFLSLEEMRTIQNHYRDLGRDPTDLELETIAQTWSEHCVHKTLKSAVRYTGAPFPPSTKDKEPGTKGHQVEITYENLLKDTIAKATHELIKSGRVDWCLSVFEDNAGIITFDDDYGVAFKVETHNHPSAIEPYGGSATGIGGVIRDVLGCGLGAKPIANTDVFCVGTPDFPMDLLPKGVLHPRRVLKGIVSGVRDYGNRMGIPTINGAIAFDDRYLGNPLVFCGCVGLIPRNLIRKEPQPGDLIVVIGGRTGRDGIHGATFSSAELTDKHADEFSHAVQIGNAITEKQVTDALLQARDHERGCLYTAVTDCGAGGLSSAVGEMGQTLGAVVDLERVPLKYAGLRYDEIWISEAQERMVFSVPPANWEAMAAICKAEGVEATVIGTFGNNGRLLIRYDGQTVGDIDTQFLHHGVPKTQRTAVWNEGSGFRVQGSETGRSISSETGCPTSSGDTKSSGRIGCPTSSEVGDKEKLLATLSQLDTSSKEWVIRQYDHEVQGGTIIKPLTGPGDGPSDAAVVRPLPGGKSDRRGIAIANGLYPSRPGTDPYWMAVASIDEAIRNIVCVGGDPSRTAILDNFCWGNCEDPEVMGALVRACQACHDAAVTYGTPFISGKDSLNNEFALDPADAERLAGRVPLHNNRIRIPETLLISAIGVIEDVSKCVTMDAKGKGSGFRVQGSETGCPNSSAGDKPSGRTGCPTSSEVGNTPLFFVGLKAREWPEANIADAARLHKAVAGLIQRGAILAAHDCGEEGWLAALAEMAFAGRCGMDITAQADSAFAPFAPVPCGYILQARPEHVADVEQLAKDLPGVTVFEVARTRDDAAIHWQGERIDLNALSEAWRSPLRW